MADSDRSSRLSPGTSPKEKILDKSSGEILNELFGTFNASFDDSEALVLSPSTIRTKQSKKHSKKDKEVSLSPKRKKKKSKDRSKDKEKPSKYKNSELKQKDKRVKDKIVEEERSYTPPLPPPKEKKKSTSKKTSPVIKYPTLKINGKTIVLDVEEGEIVEEAEKSRLKRHKEVEHEESENKHKKKRHSHEDSDDGDRRSSSSLKNREENDKHSRQKPSSKSFSSSSNRTRESYRSRSRSLSPKESSSYSTYRDKKRAYQSFRWEKARDRSPEKSYSHSSGRRSSVYDESYQKYNENRGGFGYSGNSTRYEDEYYDYRREGSRGSYSRRDRRSRSRSWSPDRFRSSHRERSTLRRLHPDDIIDKRILLEIARKNAKKLMRQGVLPTDIFSRDQILAIKAGGKSVEELTEYCKRVARRDAAGDAGDSSDEDNLIHHPFAVKERPMPAITMNIRNAIPLPIRSPHELAIENAKLKVQFPVSSGTQHRYKELEWKSVDSDEKEKGETKKTEDLSKALVPLPVSKTGTISHVIEESNDKNCKKASIEIKMDPKPASSVDIGSVISKRLRAMKDLQENPDDVEAKERLESATADMKEWAEAKALEPKFLTPSELLTGPQAWAKKDQLKTATALQGGMGMHLLQRMGWSPGEGLGKYKEGGTEPLALDIKMDKKGLASTSETDGPSLPSVFDLTGKHPVSSLMELCAKRRWGSPTFQLCFEHGPAHKRQFVYKVTVNGVEYQPCVANKVKKEAKAQAAAFCLQSLGLLPTPKPPTPPSKPAELLCTVPDASSKPPEKVQDTKLMPPPPPPAALARLLEFPLPPTSGLQIPHPAPTVCDPNPKATKPSPPTSSYNATSQNLTKPAGVGIAKGSRPLLPPSRHLRSVPHAQLEYDDDEEEFLIDAPIVQVPLPPSSLQGFPGLTTF